MKKEYTISVFSGIYRFTIVIQATEEMARIVTKQIEKQIGILKAFYHTLDEIVYQEIALYKIPTEAFANGDEVETLIRRHNARILTIEPEYIVVEKTGHKEETQALFEELNQFARSGRIALTKQIKEISAYLKEIDSHHKATAGDVVTYLRPPEPGGADQPRREVSSEPTSIHLA